MPYIEEIHFRGDAATDTCGSDLEVTGRYDFPGTTRFCVCNSLLSGKNIRDSCDRKDTGILDGTCRNLSYDQRKLQIWKGGFFCKKVYEGYQFISNSATISTNGTCPTDLQQCGSATDVNLRTCVPKGRKCPITSVILEGAAANSTSSGNSTAEGDNASLYDEEIKVKGTTLKISRKTGLPIVHLKVEEHQ
jgi:hypothetical protein